MVKRGEPAFGDGSNQEPELDAAASPPRVIDSDRLRREPRWDWRLIGSHGPVHTLWTRRSTNVLLGRPSRQGGGRRIG